MSGQARVVPFERGKPGRTVLMDTGEDSLFLWYSCDESWDRNPSTVAVHMHEEVDETIVVFGGEGYYLHGPTPEEVVKTPYKGPCLLYLPAGEYHRIVTTSEGARDSILMYSKAGAIVEPFEKVFGRAKHSEVVMAELPEVAL